MDIEQLSKSQIILLTLLISFVTSIATGIVTVSLMDQAPPSVAQSVNRIVERTVERIVPAGQTASTVVTREKTVIVKESDLISQAVERTTPSVARLYLNNSDPKMFLGFGVVLDESGIVATDVDALGEIGDAEVALQDGTHVRAFVTMRDRSSGVAFLQAATTTKEGKTPVWKPATISVGTPRLGQTVITIAGKNISRIADGIITAIIPDQSDSSATQNVIETNIGGDSIMQGGLLINTDGEVIGMSTSAGRAASLGGFISSSVLLRQHAPAKDAAALPKQ